MTTPQGAAGAGAGGQPASSGGNVFTNKLGPLPLWAWMGIGLGVALAVSSWRNNKQAAASQDAAASSDMTSAQDVPPFIIQNYTNTISDDDDSAPPSNKPPVTKPPITKPPVPLPPPKKTPPPPPKQKYTYVTVAKWPGKAHGGLAQWNTTLWGIANHYKVKGGYKELAKLNGIKNPDLIHPGQKIKVPIN